MSIFNKIFSKAGEGLINGVGGIIDNLSSTDAEKMKLKNDLTKVVLHHMTAITQASQDVITTEMKGNWLQRSWRPLMMLTFAVIIICKWFGFTDTNIPAGLEMELLSIIKIGLGGYVIGRTGEKIAKTVTQNIDMPFLKKRNR